MWEKITFIFLAASSILIAEKAMSENKALKRVYVVSQMDGDPLNNFYRMLDDYSDGKLIDTSYRPNALSETDVMVFFYENWHAAKDSYEADKFPQIFKQLDNVKSDSISFVIGATFEKEHEVKFVFYALKESGYKSLSCYAEDLVAEIANGVGTLHNCE